MKRQEYWLDKSYKDIRHQSYIYILYNGFLWKRLMRRDGMTLKVIDDLKIKYKIFGEFHNISWTGYRSVWATYTKIKECYL